MRLFLTAPHTMKFLLTLLIFSFSTTSTLAGINHPVQSELHKFCSNGGTCRLECYKSEMLVDLCLFQLECCVTGDPEPTPLAPFTD